MDQLEIEQVLDHDVWLLRLNGDGQTFDAVCTVWRLEEDLLFVAAGMSRVPDGMGRILAQARQPFIDKGFRRMRYVSGGVMADVTIKAG